MSNRPHDHTAQADAPPQFAAGAPSLSAGDLAELLGAFNDASRRLQQSHEALTSEVARLKGELKSANEQLERSRRLSALGEMAAGIAHEVRNPLGSIRLYAKMLCDDLADRPGERALAEKIAGAVRGLDAVVGDVLSFAREVKLRPQAHDPGELLDAAIEEVLAGEQVRGGVPVRVVRMDRAPSGAAGSSIVCDASLAHRALVNIIRNAVDAMRDPASDGSSPGILLVSRSTRTLPGAGDDTAQPAARVYEVLSIRDSGGGIPPESLQRIFNPFFTTRATGTGLGLAIVHRIMDAHAGAISVRNVPGAHVTLPGGERVQLAPGALVELLFPREPALPQSTVELKAGGASPLPIHPGPGARASVAADPQSHAQPLSLGARSA
ncbi:MAG TPA: ATP-binding protein [Phycisphaerales bacterium]|nr:ATP-binding protein [Phycisphaerales bacterium]